MPTNSEQRSAVVATYYSVNEAELVCANLRGGGIDARVEGQHAVSVLPMHALALGGVRVVVPAHAITQARELLSDLETPGVTQAEEDAPEHSTDIGDAAMKQAAFTSFLGLSMCPVVGTLYSLILLARNVGVPVSARGMLHKRVAFAFDLLAVLIVIAWSIGVRRAPR